jgi:hypothetical protein
MTQSSFGHVHNWESIPVDKHVEFVDDDESDPIELGGE